MAEFSEVPGEVTVRDKNGFPRIVLDSTGAMTVRDSIGENATVVNRGALTEVINVKTDFGAKGDNSADDTARIQAALDAVPDVLATRQGAGVYFPPGSYVVSNSLIPKHNTTIMGPSFGFTDISSGPRPAAKIKTLAAVPIFDDGGATLFGVNFFGLGFSGTAVSGNKGIHALTGNCWSIDQCYFQSFGDQAIHIEGGTTATFQNIFVDGGCLVRTGRSDYVGAIDVGVNDQFLANITASCGFTIGAGNLVDGWCAGVKISAGTTAAFGVIGHRSEAGIVVRGVGSTITLGRLVGCRADTNLADGFVIDATAHDIEGCLSYKNGQNADNTYSAFVVKKGQNNFVGNRVASLSSDTRKVAYGFSDSSADGGTVSNTYAANRGSNQVRTSFYNYTGSDGFTAIDSFGQGLSFSVKGNSTTATADSRYVGATASGPPTAGAYLLGDFAIDQTGTVWHCTVAGSPGTWAATKTPDPLVKASGFVGWNYNPGLTQTGTALTSQTISAMGVWLPFGVPVSSIVLQTIVAGTSTVPTGFFVGLCSATKMFAQSGNLNNDAGLTTLGNNPFALSASYTPNPTDSPTGLYYAVAFQNGAFAGTNVTFGRSEGSSQATKNIGFGSNLAGNIGTGQTALPANAGVVTLSAGGGIDWFVGVK